MNKSASWYQELRRPSFAPPSWVFGPVWTVLYLIIAISFGAVGVAAYEGTLPLSIASLFALNLVFNVAYSPIQFGLRNLLLATLDILFVLGTLIAGLWLIYPYIPWVSYVNIPYLLWVSFATVLQIAITTLNKDKWKTV